MIDVLVRCSDYGRNQRACIVYEHGRIVEFVDVARRDERSLGQLEADVEDAYRAGDSLRALSGSPEGTIDD